MTWVSGPPPKLFLHVWFLNHIEKVKKFTGKDKQIGLFAKDMKKKKKKKKCEAGYQLIPLYEKDHISSSNFSGKQSLVLILRCSSVNKLTELTWLFLSYVPISATVSKHKVIGFPNISGRTT